jgi:hypothetical protein
MPAGAVGATVKNAIRLHAMANDTTAAMSTFWRKGMDGTLKTIEHVCLISQPHFKTFVVLIAANFTNVIFFTREKIRERLFCGFYRICFLHIYLLLSRAGVFLLIFSRRAFCWAAAGCERLLPFEGCLALNRSPLKWTGCVPICLITSLAPFVSGISLSPRT